AHHLHDLGRGRAPHDRVVDQNDALALDHRAIGAVLQANAELADLLGRLDEGAPDIVIADDAELVGDAGLFGVADGGGYAGIGNRDDHVSVGTRLAGELRAHGLAHRINRAAADNRIRAREIDVLEDAGARLPLRERPVGVHAIVVKHDDFTVLDIADIFGA